MTITQIKRKMDTGWLQKLVSASASILIFGIVLFFSACDNITGGAGGYPAARAVGQPTPISTDTELALIGTDPFDYPADGDYILADDLILTGWTPICDPNADLDPFTGTFDGNGHTITLSSFGGGSLTGAGGLGIFAVTSTGAVIENLNVNFTTGPFNTTVYYAGGVAGYALGTTFSNISVVAGVDAAYKDTGYTDFDLGGVAGYAANSTFTGIKASGSITASAEMPYDYTTGNDFSVGSVVGYAAGGSISGSKSNAEITANSSQIASFAGGIVGRGANGLTITNCEGIGDVSSNGENNNTSAGGIAGYITQTTVTNSYAAIGDITVTAPSGSGQYDVYQVFAGGLVGYSGNASAISRSHAIDQNVVTENAAYPYAGGLVGYNYGVLVFSNQKGYARGILDFDAPAQPNNGSIITRSYSTNTVAANATDNGIPYAGGLAGYNSASASLIQDCYAWGDVSATTGGEYAWAGGVAGAVAAGATLERSYATGDVTVTAGGGALPYPQPYIDAGASAGGVVGYIYNYYYDEGQTTIVRTSFGLNDTVTADGSTADNWAHRVVGHNGTSPYDATITDNFGNEDMVLDPSAPDSVLDGRDTSPHPRELDFTGLGWDFNATWYMNVASGYPELF
jgi:hypothetical protein